MAARVSRLSVWLCGCLVLSTWLWCLGPARASAQVVPGNLPSEPVEVQRLRALRAEQNERYQQLRLLTEEDRELKREDRELYPVTFPIIVTATGFGASAIGLGVMVLSGYGSCDSRCVSGEDNNPRSKELNRMILLSQVVGIPLGLAGLSLYSYRLHMRPNRARIRELRQERLELRRQFREEDRANRKAWSFIPDASLNERRAGLSLRHTF